MYKKSMNIIEHILSHNSLDYITMQNIMSDIMHGAYSPEWIAAFLVAMRAKGINDEELLAAVNIMHQLVNKVDINTNNDINLVDIVGTGGDGSHTFNISTASMIVAASCGAKVAKHGNRGVSSKSGSADVLEALGVNLNISCEKIASCI